MVNVTGATGLRELARGAAVIWAVGLIIVLLALAVLVVIDVLLLVFAGALFAIFLRGLVRFLSERTGMSENWSLTLTLLLLAAALVIAGWLLLPHIAAQTDALRQSLPKALDQVETQMKQFEGVRAILQSLPAPADLLPRRGDVFARITGVVSGTMGALGALLVVLFTGLFFAIQPCLYVEGSLRLVTPSKRNRARQILAQMGLTLRAWLLAKLVAMAFVGVLTSLGLWLLGIELALALGVLAALLTFIPNFGPIISAVPAVLLGLLHGPATAAWVVALYVGIQTVESYLLTPLLQQRAVSLPPALIITAQLAMGVLVGGVGLALATPLTVLVLVLVRSLYVEDMLGDSA